MESKNIINVLSKKLGRTNKDISSLLDGFSAIIKEECGNMNTIAIPGFGEFIPQKHEEHIEFDNMTGKRMLIPPQIKLTFKSSSILRKQIGG